MELDGSTDGASDLSWPYPCCAVGYAGYAPAKLPPAKKTEVEAALAAVKSAEVSPEHLAFRQRPLATASSLHCLPLAPACPCSRAQPTSKRPLNCQTGSGHYSQAHLQRHHPGAGSLLRPPKTLFVVFWFRSGSAQPSMLLNLLRIPPPPSAAQGGEVPQDQAHQPQDPGVAGVCARRRGRVVRHGLGH